MKNKKITVITLITTLTLFLSGCVRVNKAGKPYGMIYDYLAKPTQHVMEWMANFLGGSYGWSIVVIVFVVRMILLPVMISQMRKSTITQEKMSAVAPQMKAIQARQKAAKTQEEQAAVSQEMMALYRDNGISVTGGMGCLPLLIQMPIFAALYAAIRYSPDLSSATFMGIKLGAPSILLAVLSFVTYLIQGYLSMLGVPQEQKKQMRIAIFASPVMILFFTLSSSAGLGLYFFIGGLFAIVQTFIINLYRPKIRREIEAEMKKHPTRKVVTPVVEPTTTSETIDELKQPQPTETQHKNRNAGKQSRHPES